MTIRERFDAGAAAFGITSTIVDPFLAEIVAAQPFDYVMVDAEHSPMSSYQLQSQLIALRTSSASILVRIADLDATAIGAALDLGAHGVVVPHIETSADCARAVQAALYPPAGHRGFGPRRAARLTDRSSYLLHANDSSLIVVMIESAPAVENIDEILAVDGLSAVFIGVEDLAASLSHLNDSRHPDVTAAVEVIIDRCNAADVPFGIYAHSPAAAIRLLSRGARLISVGSDLMFFEQRMTAVLDAFDAAREWRFETTTRP